MSGIVGIINLDGEPVDRELLKRMTDFIAYRGPDEQQIWVDGNVGFGHTMLRTTWESATECQPLTCDGKVWLTADARVDGRDDLIERLQAKVRQDLKSANDAELILHAYHFWGEDCVKYLIGDFAFAIWDARERKLYCARDQFGVKSLYYARVANCFVFSNTLNCLRRHPAVSATLNDLAIADFLLFGLNRDSATTTFQDIARLPGSHSLSVSAEQLKVRRYWSLPADVHLSYKHLGDYTERFRELLAESVKDRLRTDRVAVELSGGLDSTTVAATVKRLMPNANLDSALKGFCVSYERLIPDRERYYADLAAKALGIPIEHMTGDDFPLFEETDCRKPRPEPFNIHPLSAISTGFLRRVAAHSRVVLTGWDGDTWMSETPRHYFRFMLKSGQLGRLASAVSWYVRSQRQPPPFGIRTSLIRLLRKHSPELPYPRWLEPSFEARLKLAARYKQAGSERRSAHPTRPSAFKTLGSSSWAYLFEEYDAGITGLPLEARHPITDVRVVEFLLRLPPIPWCVNKEIMRAAMWGVLPDEIIRRPKTPLAGDPAVGMAGNRTVESIDRFEPCSVLNGYVKRTAVPPVRGEKESYQLWMNVRPFSLNRWIATYANQ